MASPLLIGGVIVALAAVIAFVIVITSFFRKRKEEISKNAEKSMERVESEVGLDEVAKAEAKVESLEAEAEKKEESLEFAEISTEAEVKERYAKKAIKAVEEAAETAVHEEESEKTTAAIEGKSIGIEAALKKITNALIEYTSKKKGNIFSEEQEVLVFDKILKGIRNEADAKSIDNTVNSYLAKFIDDLTSAFKQDTTLEQKKEELLMNLVKELKDAIPVMKTAVRDAKKELKKLQSEERKTRKDFKKELKDFEASINAKSKKIDEMGKNKDINPVLTVSLIRERDINLDQLKNAKPLNKQLEAEYNFIKTIVKHMRILLNNILKNDKEIKKYENILEKRSKQVNKRFKGLQEAFFSIEKISEYKIVNTHKISLKLSKSLKLYFLRYREILQQDLIFDNIVKEVITKNFIISKQMAAFQRLAAKLTQSEKTIDYGVEVLTELISGISKESSKKNIEGIVQTLKGLSRILDYEKSIETFMKNLAEAIQNKSKQLSADLQLLVEEDKKLIAQIKAEEESNSSHLGSFIGTIFKRKIVIDRDYAKEANEFAQKLKENNAISMRAYNQIMRT